MESSVASCGLLRAPRTAIRGEEKQSVLGALLLSFQVHVLKFYLNTSPSNSNSSSALGPCPKAFRSPKRHSNNASPWCLGFPACFLSCGIFDQRVAGRPPGVLSFRRYFLSMNCSILDKRLWTGFSFSGSTSLVLERPSPAAGWIFVFW